MALRERLRRLLVANSEDAGHEVRLVVSWMAAQPALRAILAEAEQAEPGLDLDGLAPALREGAGGLGRLFRWPSESEAGRAALIWHFLQQMAEDDKAGTDGSRIAINYGHALSSGSNINDMWRELAERAIRPLFDYLSERVGAESSVLYVIERYVRRVEWFDRGDLHERAMADTRKAEEVYDTDLRRFLFGEGINMPFSQARSASGLSDVVSELDTEDPLVCEVKLFDESRGKRHLASGLNQAVHYADDFGKQVAYLVIINLSGRPLSLPTDGDDKAWPPYIVVGGVRVYLIVVRALPTVSASKMGKPSPVVVTRDELVDPDAG